MAELRDTGPHTFIHGTCRGVDQTGAMIARRFGWDVEAYPALWKVHGRAAGPIRNQQMLDTGIDVLLAFPMEGGRGTQDMIRRAKKAGILTTVVFLDTQEGVA